MNFYIALKSILGLFGLWFFVYYLWRDYRLDAFRDHIFTIRDRMFLYAVNGNISLDHPAYTILRNRMNVLLRYGHAFTLTRMFLVIISHDRLKSDSLLKWEEVVEELPEEIRHKMKEFNLCVVVAVFQHIVFNSFFRYVVLRPFAFFFKPLQFREIVDRPKVVLTVEHLESDALEQEERHVAQTHAVVA